MQTQRLLHFTALCLGFKGLRGLRALRVLRGLGGLGGLWVRV